MKGGERSSGSEALKWDKVNFGGRKIGERG